MKKDSQKKMGGSSDLVVDPKVVSGSCLRGGGVGPEGPAKSAWGVKRGTAGERRLVPWNGQSLHFSLPLSLRRKNGELFRGGVT